MGDLAYLNLDPNEAPKTRSFDPIPAGTYDAMVEDCLVKRTKDLSGQYLEVRCQIMGGDHDHRLVFDRITIQGSDKAMAWGRDKLLALVRATGVAGKDSQEFVGKIMRVKVKVKPATDQYDAGNEVVTYIATDKPSEKPVSKPQGTVQKTVKPPIPSDDGIPF